MTPDSQKIVLGIEQRSKAVPYPSEDRENGEKNLGFQDLKGNEQAILAIPEIQDSPGLRDALLALNAANTPFFTVGCEKSLNVHEGKYWKRGYLEFSFNYAETIADASAYFPLFFHFSQAAHEFAIKNPIHFFWELQGARFKKIQKDGFTCCVWITNGDYDTAEECNQVWDEGLRHVVELLLKTKPSPLAPIYSPGSK